jgi:hypothetical protein
MVAMKRISLPQTYRGKSRSGLNILEALIGMSLDKISSAI